MRAHFRALAVETAAEAVPWMARLYAHEGLDYDEGRARRVTAWLAAHPDLGGVWLIEADGETAGYMVLTVGVSLEFGGPFAMLDELYLGDEWRGSGLGPQAIEFAVDWARSRRMTALRLEVGEENAHGQHVYARAGFRLHTERRLMTKLL